MVKKVSLYEITNKNQVTLTVSDFGATWVHMWFRIKQEEDEMWY